MISNNSNKSRGNVTFTELSEIINTLSSQDFAGMDKFRVRERLRNIKEMRLKISKTKKCKRNDSYMSDFLTSPFSLVMGDLSAGSSSAGESASLTLDKKRDSLESKFRRALSEKMSCLQETVSLLNQWIGEENPGRLQIEKELEVLGKDFKKQMKENRSLTSKLCQKKRKIKKTKYQKQIKNYKNKKKINKKQRLSETVYLKVFSFISHINLKSDYAAFFSMHILI